MMKIHKYQKSSFFLLLSLLHVSNVSLVVAYIGLSPVSIKNEAYFRVLSRTVNKSRHCQTDLSKISSCIMPRTTSSTNLHLQRRIMEEEKTTARKRFANVMDRLRKISFYRLRIVPEVFKNRIPSLSTNATSTSAVIINNNPSHSTTNVEEKKEQILLENDRWSTAAEHVDLSGTWKPIVTAEFKQQYDQYLLNCSQSYVFRKVIINGISLQTETIRQMNHGMDVEIFASNPAGNWNRTLTASGISPHFMDHSAEPLHVTIEDPDGDMVQVEAWWENGGTVHKSWLRGKPRVHGGEFETIRYMESPNVLVCESNFHPSPSAPASKKFQYGHVVWKFQRQG